MKAVSIVTLCVIAVLCSSCAIFVYDDDNSSSSRNQKNDSDTITIITASPIAPAIK